jgi:NADH-quinone oxidoreductase subunit J
MRVALALTATMLSLAGVYALLGVHVIAIFQVLIYVGAIMVFMIYAIMLLDVRDRSYTRRFSRLLVPGIAAAVLFAGILVHAVWRALPGPNETNSASTLFALQRFSVEFLSEYWLHFELVSVLLVAAVVAAVAVLETGRQNRG